MQEVTIKQLLEAGVHFGHQTRRWNPKMQRYIFGEKNGIYIINLELTLGCIAKAVAFLKKVASEGREVLFVGTKKQAQDVVRQAAEQCRMPYVNNRWLGGMLTNYATVQKSVARLDSIDQMEKKGDFKFITKKEVSHLLKERQKLVCYLTGIRRMKKLPGALFIVDTKKEEIALAEARKLGIPTVALLDTNCDPDLVDYPIPGNDDAIRAVKLFCDLVAAAIQEGRSEFLKIYPEEQLPADEAASVLPGTPAAPSAEETPLAPSAEETPAPSGEEASQTQTEPLPAADVVIPKVPLDEIEEKFLQQKLKLEEQAKLKAKRPIKPKESKKES